jgi:cytochrome c-type biogenesis protein CcmH
VRKGLVVLVAALLLTATAGGASAATPKTTLNAVESEVMCVSCGVPLGIADSPQATAERKDITDLIAQGKTKDEIKAELVSTYGNRVLASPKSSGFGLAAYLVPIVIVLIALVAGAIFIPKWRRNRTDTAIAPAGPDLSDDDAARLDADLQRYER